MTKREQKRDPRFDNLCLWLSGLILSGRGEKEREKEKRTVLLVTRKNGKVPRDAWQNRSSLYVVRVVKPQVRSRDCFDVDFTANSDEGLYLRTEYKPRVPVFRALSINRYHEPRRGVVWLVCPCSSVFLQRSRVNSFADTFIFRISGPYLSINIRFSEQQQQQQQQRTDSPVRHPRDALFLFRDVRAENIERVDSVYEHRDTKGLRHFRNSPFGSENAGKLSYRLIRCSRCFAWNVCCVLRGREKLNETISLSRRAVRQTLNDAENIGVLIMRESKGNSFCWRTYKLRQTLPTTISN